MDNQKERTLAYKKAHIINNEELDKVSGGSENFNFTTRQTLNQYGGDIGGDAIW